VAIYRDNCKVAQPLSMAKKEGAGVVLPIAAADAVSEVAVRGTYRREMPRVRNSKTFSFQVSDSKGFFTVGEYDDGTPGELFINTSKHGSTLRGLFDAFAISISYGLQHGVPLKNYVRTFSHMSFAPSGITDDPEIRTASSIIDYVFRKLALAYLSFDDRLELGLASIEDMPEAQTNLLDVTVKQDIPAELKSSELSNNAGITAAKSVTQTVLATGTQIKTTNDNTAPMCFNCGNITQKAGSCYVCTSCGSTTGCS